MTTPTPPNYCYDVTVNSSGEFTISPLGSAPASPITVTVPNTTITYTLTSTTNSNMVFRNPEVAHDSHNNISWEFSDNKRAITITDSDANQTPTDQNICVKLVAGFVSPDPQLKNEL